MTRWGRYDPAHLAGLFVLWAVAWSVPSGRLAADTKTDLYVDPWGFLGGALHLWDPQVTWGGLQNQAYGYLFPMGPFFGLGSELLPMWVVQRLWWAMLLTAGYVGMLGLLRALDVASPRLRIVAALAYALAPRVLSTIGGLSSEAHPQLLAPLVLWPLVLVDRGRLATRKGAALSALAVLCCGGVNATATAFAVLPSAIWLLTRQRWWRAPLTWVCGVLLVAATSWWAVPLVVLGRYSPPFLDWIENAGTVTSQITALDVLRGTTAWLGHLVTSAGPWWPAGFELVSSRTSILLTTAVAAMGLVGLMLRRLPERTFLVSVVVVGVVVIALPHEGALASPVAQVARDALDGPLAALRNVHKADLLVRLPLCIGLAHLLARVATWRPQRPWLRGAALATPLLVVVGAAAPGFGGAIAPRGTFDAMAPQWQELGAWLDDRQGARSLIVPAANFAEYVWGRPMDEPLRPLTDAPYAVRDAVPLAPAGTVRMLDEVEMRLTSGRSIAGAATMLRESGVSYLVLRNDLGSEAGQPPVALTRSALLNTPDVSFVRGFGKTWLDAAGERVFPIEVYALAGEVAPELALWDVRDVIGASGAAEDLARLDDAGRAGRPVVFDGDRTAYLVPETHVVTDGFRARSRWFGAPRGQDVSSGLGARAAAQAPDYLPWSEVSRRSVVEHRGVADVRASSSVAEQFTVVGLQPAHRPFAAVDGNRLTAWVTTGDAAPELTVELERPTALGEISIEPLHDTQRFGRDLGVATVLTVTTDRGEVDVRLDAKDLTRVRLPEGSTRTVSLRIRDTTRGAPGGVVTGLTEVRLPGVRPTEVVRTPSASEATSSAAVLGWGRPGRDGCSVLVERFTCFVGQSVDPESTGPFVREVAGLTAGRHAISGTLAVDPLRPPTELLTVPGVDVGASSRRSDAPAARPIAVADSDPRTAWSPAPDDETPSVTLTLKEPTRIEGLRLQTRDDWARRVAPAVVVNVDGDEVTRRLPEHGVISIPPTTGRRLTLTFVAAPGGGRPSVGSLQLEELELIVEPFAPPASELRGDCGTGPRLLVDGRSVPTAAVGSRDAMLGLADITWRACGDVSLSAAVTHSISLEPWRGLVPRTALVSPLDDADAGGPRAVAHSRTSPTSLRAVLPDGEARLLAMTENTNPGWVARLDGTALEPQVVDGRRQGFIVPEGASGELVITFEPDRAYRWGLAIGLGLAALVVVLAVWPASGARPPSPPTARSRVGRWWVVALAGIFAGLLAGPVGLVVGLVCGLLATVRRPPDGLRIGVVATAAVTAAVLQLLVAPGTVGGSVLEGGVRLLVLVAFTVALAGGESRDQA
ncbi:alpha-(1-_3)-arabinofuranosyltransferase family protein [Rothia sp. ARF10]|nr:alpha-(1->3)-arabinofuranosyltransferase family protein [Rothia sp. ARF10]